MHKMNFLAACSYIPVLSTRGPSRRSNEHHSSEDHGCIEEKLTMTTSVTMKTLKTTEFVVKTAEAVIFSASSSPTS
ncbi:hypothetical protein F442_02269, partial [Phytophthora nicotianae P10297]